MTAPAPVDLTGYTPSGELYAPFTPAPLALTVQNGGVVTLDAAQADAIAPAGPRAQFAFVVPRSVTCGFTASPVGGRLKISMTDTAGRLHTYGVLQIDTLPNNGVPQRPGIDRPYLSLYVGDDWFIPCVVTSPVATPPSDHNVDAFVISVVSPAVQLVTVAVQGPAGPGVTVNGHSGTAIVLAAADVGADTPAARDTAIAAAVAPLAPAGLYSLDGLAPSALISAPRGVMRLQGADVPVSSLLTFSSAQKYTVGRDGAYVLNAANAPAYDWGTGRRRMLLEGLPATNYWGNSENAAAWPVLYYCSTSVSANALLGVLALATLTATAATGGAAYAGISVMAGDVVTLTAALRAGNVASAGLRLSGSTSGDAAAGDTSHKVISGPGTVTALGGGRYTVSGLSATVPTIVSCTRTARTTETIYGYIIVTGLYTAALGDTIKAGRPQLEYGYGSSYIPSGSSPTTRVADVVNLASGALGLVAGAQASLAVRGRRLSGSTILSSGNRSGRINLSGSGAGSYPALVGPDGVSLAGAPGTADDAFGLAVGYSGLDRKVASSGGAVLGDGGHGLFGPADTSIGFGCNFLLDELAVWPFVASDSGLSSQARTYA